MRGPVPRAAVCPAGSLVLASLACLTWGCDLLERAAYEDPLPSDAVEVLACNPISGSLSFMGPALESSMRMAAEEINAGGGIAGRALRLVLADTHSDEQAALAEARFLVDEHRIVGIAGASEDSASKALLLEIARNAFTYGDRIPIVSPASSSVEFVSLLDQYNLFFRTVCSSHLQGRILADKARERGHKLGVSVGLADLNNREIFRAFRDRFAATGNIVESYFYDGSSIVTISETVQQAFRKVEEKHGEAPEFVLVLAYGDDGKIVLNEWARRFSDRPLLLSGSLMSDFFLASLDRQTIGALERGVVDGIFPTSGGASKGSSIFTEAFCPRFPQHCRCETDPCDNTALVPEIYAGNAYDAIYLLALGLTRAALQDARSIERGPSWNLSEIQQGILAGTNRDATDEQVIYPGSWRQALDAMRDGEGIDYEGTSGIELDLNGDPVNCSFVFWSVEAGRTVFKNSDGAKEEISLSL